ncbi:NF-kappa-B inhibitor-like protein 1 [Podospora australis]|uniref:NF-kappa-B inhibitor-like protein 1 n=1 Tax=Podospora australis TaxID=1536484 RepID=A0AAN6WYR2_9PEZI|nr:NF-kappa-B inhibitor-like protein 1 [Podospora australis]
MEDSPRSPKRRRILSSINPPDHEVEGDHPPKRRHRETSQPRDKSTPPRDTAPRAELEHTVVEEEKDNTDDRPKPTSESLPKATKFRFKSEKSSRRRDRDRRHRSHRERSRSRSREDKPRSSRHDRSRSRSRSRSKDRSSKDRSSRRHSPSSRTHRHHRHHHRSSRSHRSKPPSPARSPPPDPFSAPLDPETAFRESLFDAMADDEGAAYWEAIYGQPIHIYPPPGPSSSSSGGVLESMTEEEYATYVRQKMWEKTHAGLLEAKARREKEREAQKAKEEEARRITKEMERSLQKGEERRRKRQWRHKWEEYQQKWKEWDGTASDKNFPWPPLVGEEMDLKEVRAFFVNGLNLEELGEKEFVARLKEERVRWHPDKVQQRLLGEGKEEADKKVMKRVTAVFQVVDALWGEMRKNMASAS